MSKEDLRMVRHLFIRCCPSLPKPQDVDFWSSTRKKRVEALIKLYGMENIANILFKKVEQSDFLTNRNGKWSGCSFDWIIKPENVQKIVEGNFDNRCSDKPHERSYDIEKAIYEAEYMPVVYRKKERKDA